jgi:hypothetical protein
MQVLCKSLTYRQGRPEMLKGQPISRGISLYQPPFEEFQVLRVSVDQPGSISIPAQQSPMILLGLETAGAHGLQVDSPAAPLSSWACTMMCHDGCPFILATHCLHIYAAHHTAIFFQVDALGSIFRVYVSGRAFSCCACQLEQMEVFFMHLLHRLQLSVGCVMQCRMLFASLLAARDFFLFRAA